MDYKKASEYVWRVVCICVLAFILIAVCMNVCRPAAELKSKIELENQNRNSASKIEIENRVSELKTENENGISYYKLTNEYRIEIVNIVAGEAGGGSTELQMAVAQVVMNQLIKNENRLADIQPLFDGYKTIDEIGIEEWNRCYDSVSNVFDYGEMILDNHPLYFYNREMCYSEWHESLNFISEIEGTAFFTVDI